MKERTPAVFAVENDYQIMVPTDAPSLMWVEVGGKKYYDASNGIMRSLTEIHRMTVPMSALDAAGEYTVCERVIINRKPYFPEIEDAVRTTYTFTPNLDTVAGVVDYSYTGHTYREEVTFDTVPGFEAVAHGDCIAVYMAPENNDCLYDGLSVDIEVRYTYDSTDKADRFITYYPINITIDGNLGGYGQCLIPITSGDKKITKVVVSVVDVSGYVIKSKGLYAFDYTK